MKLSQHVVRTGMATGMAMTAAWAVAFMAPAAQAAPLPKPHKPAVAPMHAYCLDPAPSNLDTHTGHTIGNNVNLRVGSGTNCASVGQAQTGQNLDYYCYTYGLDGYSWTYVKDLNTGKSGWIRDDLLVDSGSFTWCGH